VPQLAEHAPAIVDLALTVVAVGAAVLAMSRASAGTAMVDDPRPQPQRRLRFLSLDDGCAQAPVQKRII
jgi:hypothetical protein